MAVASSGGLLANRSFELPLREAAVHFYRDLVGLPVIDEFRDSYGEDGTIFGLPGWPVHLEVVRSRKAVRPIDPFDQIVIYLPDEAAVEDATRKLRANGVNPTDSQHPYWDDNGGVTFLDPDRRGVIYVSWVYGEDPPLNGWEDD